MIAKPPPRIFGIPALEAPVVAVLKRGPSDWWQIGKWSVDVPQFEPGAWFKGSLYPQRCDLSPDGRWFTYLALRGSAEWEAGTIYQAVSRLPWLTALVAWEEGTTYARGVYFDDEKGASQLGNPDVGTPDECLKRYGLKLYEPIQFAVERRRGWSESSDSPPRSAGMPWDDGRLVTMEKRQPGAVQNPTLAVSGRYAGFRTSPDVYEPAEYSLGFGSHRRSLETIQWADWTADGRLISATASGHLEIHDLEEEERVLAWSEDLAGFNPDPQPAPSWAKDW